MTEILTESFCERCGTRYTFESARPKTRLGGVKVLSRGLKNFVLSDDTSIDEAMAAARSEAEREMSAHQLDAFHKTFSFCMSCRQYTCPNCWNEAEARCLSCAPLALPETPVEAAFTPAPADYLIGEAEPVQASGTPAELAAAATTPEVDAPFDDLRALREAVLLDETEPAPANGTHPELVEAEADAETALAAEEASLAAAEVEVAADAERDASIADEPAVEAAADAPQAIEASETLEVPAEPAAAPAPAQPATTDPARKASSQTLGLLRRFRPGQNLDAELAAFERERVEPQAEAEPEVAAEPEPVAAAPEPVAAEPEPVAAAPAVDVVEQPTWRITAPDTTPSVPPPAPGAGQVPLQAGNGSAPAGEPQWPSRPEWPSSTPAAGLPFLGRPATPQGGVDALWAASNQELVNAAGPAVKPAATTIQPCVSCGLSLSATARFCRRCGTLQGR